jgi:hypothetical protein
MVRLKLARRHEIWLPTFLGGLILFAFAGAAATVASLCIHPFLAPDEPAPGAQLLVVEGWLEPRELDQAVAAFKNGQYQMIVTTGGPIEHWAELSGASNYAELAANYLRKHGLESAVLAAVPADATTQDRTFLSAARLRDWTSKRGLEPAAMDVFSAGTHARRSRMLYRMVFGPNTRVGILSARSPQYDEDHWWRSSAGVRSVMGEAISVAWTACCFHPPPAGSHDD